MIFPFGETVDVITAGAKVDPRSGDEVADWEAATEATVAGVAVEPRPSQEPQQDARNAIVSGFTLYLPADATVTARNRIRVRGEVYDVLGEPALWRSPFTGWEPGQVVQVGRQEG